MEVLKFHFFAKVKKVKKRWSTERFWRTKKSQNRQNAKTVKFPREIHYFWAPKWPSWDIGVPKWGGGAPRVSHSTHSRGGQTHRQTDRQTHIHTEMNGGPESPYLQRTLRSQSSPFRPCNAFPPSLQCTPAPHITLGQRWGSGV